jgi:hypothetical protein
VGLKVACSVLWVVGDVTKSLKGGSSVSSTEAYVGDSGDSRVHTQADLE